ncbi:hypothetical protein AAC387_Pa05g0839 [Persea americana]
MRSPTSCTQLPAFWNTSPVSAVLFPILSALPPLFIFARTDPYLHDMPIVYASDAFIKLTVPMFVSIGVGTTRRLLTIINVLPHTLTR